MLVINPATLTAMPAVAFQAVLYNHIHNRTTTIVLWPFVCDYQGEQVPEETFTHSHLSWSLTIHYQLLPSIMIHSILPVQFTCLTVFLYNLSPSPFWSTSWSGTLTLHFIHHTLSSFRNTCPYHRNLFCCSTEIMSSIPSLSTSYAQ